MMVKAAVIVEAQCGDGACAITAKTGTAVPCPYNIVTQGRPAKWASEVMREARCCRAEA